MKSNFNKQRNPLIYLIISCVLSLVSVPAYAGQITVTGKVTDNGTPMQGVSIVVKGTSTGRVTDDAGGYTVTVPDGDAVLQFSFLGYVSQEVRVGTQRNIEISMQPDAQRVDDVVVIGYGTVAKRDLTGSVSKVSGEELTAFTVSDPVVALQGMVPGVQVSQNTGDPAGDYNIRIRGVNSVIGSNDPLYIIDGIPSNTATISTYDIASLEVLKDASATAIYGSRGANGVVMITTKRGRTGKPSVSYDFEYAIQSQINRLDMMDASTWARFYNDYLINTGTLETAPFTEEQIGAFGKGTDWQKEMFKNAPMQNHNLNVSGGSDNIRYFVSGSMLQRDGLIYNSSYDKYTLRSSLDFTVSPMIDASLQMGYSSNTRMNQSGGGGGDSSMMGAIYAASPILTPFDENGDYMDFRSYNNWSWMSHELKNPMNIAHEISDKTVTNLSNVNAAVTFKPVKGLSLRSTLGLQNSDARNDKFTSSKYIYTVGVSEAAVSEVRRLSVVNENILDYNVTLGDAHRFGIMAGYTYQQEEGKSISASGKDFFSDVLGTNDLMGAGQTNSPDTGYDKWVLMSWLGRINYSLLDRYLFTVSFRADGSSRYSPDQRWGYFPSAAVAWRISDEGFMENINHIVSDMKLRVGWGQTGSTALAPYQTQNLLTSGKTATGNGNYTWYAPGSQFPHPLKWETTSQWNFGLDLGFLDDRIRITADYYRKMTTDLLNRVSLPSSSGYAATIRNIGSMSNRGVEFQVDADIVKHKDFGFTASFNIAHNRNRIEKLAGGEDFGSSISFNQGTVTILKEGEPMGAFYVYKDTGLDEAGRMSYHDFNGDEQYTNESDRYIAGSPFPDFTYGLNVGLRWKNLDFNFFLQGSQGNEIFNNAESRNYHYSQGLNIEDHVFANSWTENNKGAHYPKIGAGGTFRLSDRFLEDGSYLRLKNVQLAYNFSTSKWKTSSWLKGIRVYVSAQNYLTFTKYRGVDPEVSSYAVSGSGNGDANGGIDNVSYPGNKTITFGVSIKFN